MSEQAYNKTYFAKAPSNIALVKYWGKEHRQIPLNPSISFTLSSSVTKMEVTIRPADEFSLKVILDDQENGDFSAKLETKLIGLIDQFPWLAKHNMVINTKNTFPHSAGIASSASSMCALAQILLAINNDFNNQAFDLNRVSYIARLLSGSASRSVNGPIMLWGAVNSDLGSNEYAVTVNKYHDIYKTFKDTILVVDEQPKKISSSHGHSLMNSHPYRDSRIKLAKDHTRLMLSALVSGDLSLFGHILEQEALGLHALMMTSDPSYTLLRPQSLEIIESLKEFRLIHQCDCYFTLDAGPNIHLLYPEKDQQLVKKFISQFRLVDILEDKINLEVTHES